jgi:hypothetical protein
MADSDIIVSLHLVIPFISMIKTDKNHKKKKKDLGMQDLRCHDSQHYDTQPNGTQHNDAQFNNT